MHLYLDPSFLIYVEVMIGNIFKTVPSHSMGLFLILFLVSLTITWLGISFGNIFSFFWMRGATHFMISCLFTIENWWCSRMKK